MPLPAFATARMQKDKQTVTLSSTRNPQECLSSLKEQKTDRLSSLLFALLQNILLNISNKI
jgi:hypothetical protein